MLGRHFIELIDPDFQDSARAFYAQQFEPNEFVTCSCWIASLTPCFTFCTASRYSSVRAPVSLLGPGRTFSPRVEQPRPAG